MANDVTINAIATAQTTKASGEAAPSFVATSAGRTKIPAPIVVLTMFAVRLGTPSARINFASTGGSTNALIRRRLRDVRASRKSLVVVAGRCSTVRHARFT